MDPYQHRRHNKNLLMVHLIFVTKYRKKILHGSLQGSIKQYLYNTCVRYHWYIRRMETIYTFCCGIIR
ncbi:MAG: transposase, partial [Clostridiales bacterium]|nr:transposase [Clostridiales bacterium]